MTVSSLDNKVEHVADGIKVDYDFDFEWNPNEPDTIKVYLDGVTQPTGYTVTDTGTPGVGGRVTFDIAPADQVIVSLLREETLDQTVDYTPYDPFPAETHEGALDKLTRIDQQLQEEISRAIVAPIGSDPDVDYTMPLYDAGKGIVWDEVEKKLTNSDVALNQITTEAQASADAAAASAGAASVSEGNAAASAAAAATSAGNAATSETNAATSASEASADADRAENAIPIISEDPPTGGVDGQVWYQYTPGAFGAGMVPLGGTIMYPANQPDPPGYQEADGTLLLTANFPLLHATLGTMFGGDGITTFGVPNLKAPADIKYIVRTG